jgi:carboxymethylenebutenolidase
MKDRFADDVEGIDLAIDRDGRMMGVYVVRPAGGRRCPGVLLLPDAWGMREAMRDFARRVAGAGYAVAMPDLYYHLDWWSQSASREQMLSAKESVEPDRVAADAGQVVAAVGAELGLSGAWGLVGLCMSGRFAIRTLSAMPETFAAASVLYGTDMLDEGEEGLRDRLSRMRTDFALFYGDRDPWVPLSDIELLRRAFAGSGRTYDLHVFPGASHGFAHPTSDNYRRDAAEQAWSRTFELFSEKLS